MTYRFRHSFYCTYEVHISLSTKLGTIMNDQLFWYFRPDIFTFLGREIKTHSLHFLWKKIKKEKKANSSLVWLSLIRFTMFHVRSLFTSRCSSLDSSPRKCKEDDRCGGVDSVPWKKCRLLRSLFKQLLDTIPLLAIQATFSTFLRRHLLSSVV